MPTPTYEQIPALAAYIDRIGATQLNFKKFIVKKFRGTHYYVEKCLITINPVDFSITCTDKEYAPTPEEATAIVDALNRIDFPRPIECTVAQYKALKATLAPSTPIYPFFNHRTGGIIMAQERAMINGRKVYVPWTMWSDGEWRRMEPDQKLPFWKPQDVANQGRRIMVHEGAKTADYVQNLCHNPENAEALKLHPWGEYLKLFTHWGQIGGALAPHRTDYEELRNAKPDEVIYVCDNDWQGKQVLPQFSRHYGGAMKGIMFDERWPHAWDLADPMPEAMFNGDLYIGPSMRKLTQFATWATETRPNPQGGKPVTVTRSDFAQEWFHCVTPEVFVHSEWPSNILTLSEFNSIVKPFSDVDDTGRLLKSNAASKSAVLKYSPAVNSGIYNDDNGNRFMNTYSKGNIEPRAGSPKPWLDYMEHLIVDADDRYQVMRWCATLIARPDIKMLYGILVVSEVQGVGKSTLGEKILAPLVGEGNASYPSENEIVESNFNYWASHKRLAIIHEIYAGHSSKAYNKLKSVITDRFIQVNKKYQAAYEIENWIHIFACSNSPRALQLSIDDRRWLVPKVTLAKRDSIYWIKLNHWLTQEGGLGIIKQWALDFLDDNPAVNPGEGAPWSLAKKEVIEEGYSPGQILVSQFLERAKAELADDEFMLDQDLVTLIKDHIHEGRQSDRLEKPGTLRKLAKAQGWYVGEERCRVPYWGMRNTYARIISKSATVAATEGAVLHREGKHPTPVASRAQAWLAL